jgi:similar to spore coat protein
MQERLALHERLELQEILTFKNLCLTKASVIQGLVNCEELKGIFATDVKEGKHHVEQLSKILEKREVVI